VGDVSLRELDISALPSPRDADQDQRAGESRKVGQHSALNFDQPSGCLSFRDPLLSKNSTETERGRGGPCFHSLRPMKVSSMDQMMNRSRIYLFAQFRLVCFSHRKKVRRA